MSEQTSWWWYCLPLLGLIGGIMAYIAFREQDYFLARRLLFWGVAVQVIIIVLYISWTYYLIWEVESSFDNMQDQIAVPQITPVDCYVMKELLTLTEYEDCLRSAKP